MDGDRLISRSLLVGLSFLLLFGCLLPLTPSTNQTQNESNVTYCRTVESQEPYTEEVCQNVSRMEEFCENRELNYSLAPVEVNFVCVNKDLCIVWGSDGTCLSSICSKGMTRCRSNITNLDSQKSGTWSVAANFSFDNAVFAKNPIVVTLLPNETSDLDFEQFYEMDLQQSQPDCTIFVATPAKLQDCNFITKIVLSCSNVTMNRTIEKVVCE